MTKQELAQKYGVSQTTLRTLMNDTFYKELKEVGYDEIQKQKQFIAPRVLEKFIELYGTPTTDKVFKE